MTSDQSEPKDQPSPQKRQRTILLWAIALGLIGLCSLSLWHCCFLDKPSRPLKPLRQRRLMRPLPASEAAARAEWEAQMQRVQGVLQSMDRAELIGNSPTKGPQDAEIVLIKFSDFQCPYCAIAAADMKTFTQAHTTDVLYVYKNFPLVSIHPEAMPAAKAAWAAGQQDQFWLYHDGLFAYQR